MKQILHEQEFNDSTKSGLTVALFTSNGCFPCGIMKSAIKKVEKMTVDKNSMKFINMDINELDALSESYNIENIPTMIIFNEGIEIKRSEGSIPIKQIKSIIAESVLACQ